MSPPCKSIPQLFSKAYQSKPKKQAKMRRDHGTNMLISNPSSSSCKCQERVVQLSRLDRRSSSHKREMQQPTLPQMASRWATIFLLLALKHGTYCSDWTPSWQKLHMLWEARSQSFPTFSLVINTLLQQSPAACSSTTLTVTSHDGSCGTLFVQNLLI